MDYLDRIPDEDASVDESLYFANFMTFLGYYILGIKMPDYVKNEFYNSSISFLNPDYYTIYNMFKNAPDLNDDILRQMVIKLIKDI
jgi:hypothetical protein